MEQKNEKQHIQLPNNMSDKLSPKDLLIYLYIKSYANGQTWEAFPSLETLHQDSGAAINTIRSCIKNLVDAGKIEIRREGRKNIYKFLNFNDGFEPFSYNFLNKKDLTFSEKAQLVASQQHLFKDPKTGDGTTNYSTRQLAEIINMPESTVRKNLNSLINKGYVEVREIKDEYTGLVTKQKIYHLTKLEQAIVFILKNHEDRLTQQEDRLSQQEQELKELKEFLLQDKEMQDKFNQFKKSNLVL